MNEELAKGLRQMADFLEQHSELPLVSSSTRINMFVDKEQLAVIAKAASWKKGYSDSWMWLRREFPGLITLEVNIEREHVCRKVKTGTKIVQAHTVPEAEIELFEWVCDEPLLEASTS